MRRIPPIDPVTWDTAQALSARTGIPARLHYDTLAGPLPASTVAERIAWYFKASPWNLVVGEVLVLVALGFLVFALAKLA